MRRSFAAILDEALELVIAHGESVEACVARYPEFEKELREALESVLRLRGAFAFQPDPDRKREARIRMLAAFERRRGWRILLAGWLGGLGGSWRRLAVFAPVAVLALVAACTGTVLAADGSMPGDVLYPAKRVGERVRLMTAFTDAREASVKADLLTRRVEELEVLAAQGQTRFVPRLAYEIQRLSERASVLAEVSVAGEMARAQEALRLAGQSSGGGPPPSEVAVRTDPLLMMHGQFDMVETRLRDLSVRTRASAAQLQIQAVADILSLHRSHTSRTLEQVDSMRLAAGAIAGPPVGYFGDGAGDVQWREVGSRVLGADLVVAGGQVRLDLLVELSGGERQRVYLSPAGAGFLRGDRPGRLNDLRIGSEVVLVMHPDTGQVRVVRIAP